MARIVFNSIEFRNFQSFGNSITHVDLDKEQISLICGANGHGKTCVIQTISFALFGKSLTGITKGDLINNKNKRGMWVKLDFTICSDHYSLERGAKPDVLQLTKNGQPVEIQGDSRIFQKNLEENILKFNFKSFKQLVCLGAEFTKFFKMNAQDRRTFIEGILDLQVLGQITTLAKEDLKKTKSDCEAFTYQLSEKRSNLAIYKKEQEQEQGNITQKIEEFLNERDSLLGEVAPIKGKILTEEQEINTIIQNTSKCDEILKDLTNRLQKIVSEGKVLSSKLDELNKELEFFKTHSVCPTCLQNIGEDFIKTRIDKLSKDISQNNSKKNELIELYKEIKGESETYTKRKESLYTAKLEHDTRMFELKKDLSLKEARISYIEVEVEKIKANKPGGNREQVIQALELEVSDLEKKQHNYEARVEIYNTLLKILSDSGVKQAIISNYIDFINQQLAIYLERFNFNFSIEFDSEFNDTILMDFREPTSYEALSEGQKARVEFCILMVWRDIAKMRNSVSTNLLSIDELFDSALDDKGMQDMIDVLKGEDSNIFVISHKNVKSMFEHIYEVTKEEYGFSELVEL